MTTLKNTTLHKKYKTSTNPFLVNVTTNFKNKILDDTIDDERYLEVFEPGNHFLWLLSTDEATQILNDLPKYI